ncbi:MAG: hypothetical protein MJA83_04485 [Gammaproteobacteria bacterium]|nr:hypothetical protein [Gammaproteobacteria bacterium]
MQFFIPTIKDHMQAEDIYTSVRSRLLHDGCEIDSERYFWLTYDDGSRHLARVGDKHDVNGETVVAIFKAKKHGWYYVCTYNRGVSRGEPILVGEKDVISVETFD